MKLLPVFIAMVIGCVCFGQKKDSLSEWRATTGTGRMGDLLIFGVNTTSPKQDTVRCIMLVCDTVNHRPMSEVFRFNDTIPIMIYNQPPVWWQLGYMVISFPQKTTTEGWAYIDVGYAYLDQNKKPLSKNIIVWITKEIKQ